MLRDFVEAIAGLARSAAEAKVVELPNNQMLVLYGDTVEKHSRNRKTHKDNIASLQSLIDWSLDREDLVFKVSDVDVAVVSNRDMPHESDSASLSLERSAAYADLLDWCKSTRSVAQTVKGLRTKLAGTFDSGYVSIFSRLDFKRRNDGTKSAAHTGESMGKMVEAAAQSSAGEIPEVILFRVKLFAGMAISEHDLRFAVTVDPNAETISIAPVGDCIQDAHQATRVELLTRLKKEFPESLVIESV
jgi:hypothetical protein